MVSFIDSCGALLTGVVICYTYNIITLKLRKIENPSTERSYFKYLAQLYQEINDLINQNNKHNTSDSLKNFIYITSKCLYEGQDIIYFFNIPTLWTEKKHSIWISDYQKRIIYQVKIILCLLEEYSKSKLDTTNSLIIINREFNRILLKISILKEVIKEYFIFQKTSHPIFNINSSDNIVYKCNEYFLDLDKDFEWNSNKFYDTTYIEEFQKNCSIKLGLMFNSLYEQLELINEQLIKKYINQTISNVDSSTENTIDENLITINDNIDINNLVFSQTEITNLIEKPIPAIGVPVSNIVN